MRRVKKKEINIFSTSALDLFASAMGAFVLIAVIAMPYYLNIDQTDIVKKQEHKILALEKELKKASANKVSLIEQISKLKTINNNKSKKIEDLQKKLKKSIKFALLGIPTTSDSFTITIDMSGSVLKYKKTIKSVLHRLLAQMKNRAKIQIIGYYSLNGEIFLKKYNNSRTLINLNNSNYKKVLEFTDNLIDSIKNNAKTPTYTALKSALEYKSEDIILISDGEPTDKTPKEIINDISKNNQNYKKIHSIAIGNYIKNKSFSKFMMDLSLKNNGGFIGIASID